MARTASIFARVEPEIKDKAEQVFERLGIPMSNAIDCFLRQVVYQQRIPFEIKLPRNQPVHTRDLSNEALYSELQLGIDDLERGNLIAAETVRENLNNKYNL
jgi:addiction module RelB/DinJ family antitoxin